jgi:hypothetical protein
VDAANPALKEAQKIADEIEQGISASSPPPSEQKTEKKAMDEILKIGENAKDINEVRERADKINYGCKKGTEQKTVSLNDLPGYVYGYSCEPTTKPATQKAKS